MGQSIGRLRPGSISGVPGDPTAVCVLPAHAERPDLADRARMRHETAAIRLAWVAASVVRRVDHRWPSARHWSPVAQGRALARRAEGKCLEGRWRAARPVVPSSVSPPCDTPARVCGRSSGVRDRRCIRPTVRGGCFRAGRSSMQTACHKRKNHVARMKRPKAVMNRPRRGVAVDPIVAAARATGRNTATVVRFTPATGSIQPTRTAGAVRAGSLAGGSTQSGAGPPGARRH